LVDGKGPLPDSNLEILSWISIGLLVAGGFVYFSGLDAQLEFMVSEPRNYFGLDGDFEQGSEVIFSQKDIDLMNTVTVNRLGANAVGGEVGFCGGVDSSGDVFDFRLAENLDTSLTGVRFECVTPRSLTVHSQPFSSGDLSDEDKSFEGEFRPDVTCIQFAELSVSPVSGLVGGINCFDVDNGFEDLEVVRE